MSANLPNLNQAFILKYASVSGSSLLWYDYLITFSFEVEYIWKAPWTGVKAGFLLNRYGNLIGLSVIALQETGLFGFDTREPCSTFRLFCALFMFFSGESVRFVVIMRAWAIWGCTYRTTLWLVASYMLYLFALVGVGYYLWQQGSAPRSLNGSCLPEISRYSWLLWLAALVVDSIVLMMVCHSLRRSFIVSRNIPTLPLIRLLLRDAIFFYAATLFNDGLSIICWTMFRQDPRVLLQLVLSFPIISISGQRLVLNLRRLRVRPYTSSYVSRVVDHQLAAVDEVRRSVDAFPGGVGTATPTIELIERSVR